MEHDRWWNGLTKVRDTWRGGRGTSWERGKATDTNLDSVIHAFLRASPSCLDGTSEFARGDPQMAEPVSVQVVAGTLRELLMLPLDRYPSLSPFGITRTRARAHSRAWAQLCPSVWNEIRSRSLRQSAYANAPGFLLWLSTMTMALLLDNTPPVQWDYSALEILLRRFSLPFLMHSLLHVLLFFIRVGLSWGSTIFLI